MTNDAQPDRSHAVSKAGWVVAGLGAVFVLWGVLHVADAGYGSTPQRDFAHRRSYNMVKRDVHAAIPSGLVRALAGGVLIWLGLRTGRRNGRA